MRNCFLFVLLLTLLPTAYAKRYALIIGNSHYARDIGKLKNPVNDASDMAAILRKKQFNVTVIKNANKRQMKNSINAFTRQLNQKDAVGLFFFAGHGMEVNGRNYLIPIGANIQGEGDVEYEAVDAGRVMSGMKTAGNSLNMVILDACRNNPFGRSFRGASRGLARMSPPEGSLVLYATSPGKVAADGDGRNGLFTKYLLQAIDTPNLTVEKVFKTTAINVYRATGKKQLPWQSGVMLGDFYFSGNAVNQSVAKVESQLQIAHLTLKTSPANARIRILNIVPKYQPGIELNPGSYHIEVTTPGYQRHVEWLELTAEDKVHSVVLSALNNRENISAPAKSASNSPAVKDNSQSWWQFFNDQCDDNDPPFECKFNQ